MIELTYPLTNPNADLVPAGPALTETTVVAPAVTVIDVLVRPFRRNGRGGFQTAGFIGAVRAAVGQVLGTELGSFTADPSFGSRLYLLRQRQENDEVGQKLATAYVIESLRKWEPRARVRNVSVNDTYDATLGATIRMVKVVFDIVLPGSRSVVRSAEKVEFKL